MALFKRIQIKILGAKKWGYTSGISVVAHMKNPKIPAFILIQDIQLLQKLVWWWHRFNSKFKDKRKIFSLKVKTFCESKKNYKKYREWCDKYFFLPHRNEPRGVGGIFFDYENRNWEKDFKFVREVGMSFLEISTHIIKRKMKIKYNNTDKDKQLFKRGRYIEFNLFYDRGTKFGLNSGGNTDAILMSLHPKAKW